MSGSRFVEARAGTVPYAVVRETHTGLVVLVGDRAYKAKKPVSTDFLDFSTPQAREQACAREIALNSRLDPRSYLGLAHLSDPLGGPAEPVVVMRRYPDSSRLAFMVQSGRHVHDELNAIAEQLARFHNRAERGPQISAQGKVDAIEARWQENLAELHRYAQTGMVWVEAVEQVRSLATTYLAGRAVLFTQRIDDGRIIDGHGDLLADDIFCLADGPAILDCLEFDDRLRFLDGIDDAAFLAMDLESLGRKDLGDYFINRYAALSNDTAPMSLRDFYIAYRAVVRAKVECLRCDQGKQEARFDAVRHLDMAVDHLRHGAVRAALIGGAPGTGKTTLARALAAETGAQVISTDDVRRELRESGVIAGEAGALDSGLYAPRNVEAVYDAVLRRARPALAGGVSVILDGTWQDPARRQAARRLTAETHSAMVEIVCTAPVEQSRVRAGVRPVGTSDATAGIAEALAGRGDHWDTAHRLHTQRPLTDCVRYALDLWRRTG
jgi:aminoglycoside phosphotransferase family enzyme/predicted kinase